jgi:hypothetical protein
VNSTVLLNTYSSTVHNYYCIVVMRHDGERKLAVLAILMLHECC